MADYKKKMAAAKARGEKPILYLTFSGHGALTKEGHAFLALADGGLSQEILYDDILAELPTAYSHLLIDACHAGGVVGVRGGFFDKEVEGKTAAVEESDMLPLLQSRRIARFPNVGFILATTVGQEAHEWSEIESGVFTHELISGLLGPADVNGDLKIEYTEVQAFVASANRNIKDPRAIPHVVARPPAANHGVPLVSLDSIRQARMLKGDAAKLGHFYIELDNGQRYLDAHVGEKTEVSILLPSSRTTFLRTDTGEGKIPTGTLIAFNDISITTRSVAERGSIATSYRTALFSSPYGKDYYQGFVDSIGATGVRFPEPAPPELRLDAAPSPSGHKKLSIGLFSVAGASALASVTTGILAYNAKQDFNDTDLQRPAHDAKERYDRYRTISIATGVTAVAAGVAAWWLWPNSETKIVPATSGRGDYSLAVEVSW